MKISDLEEFSHLFNVKTKEECIAEDIIEDLKLTEQEINGFNTLLEYLKPLIDDEDLQTDIDLILNSDSELKEKVESKIAYILEKRKSKIKS